MSGSHDHSWDEIYQQDAINLPWYHPFMDPDLEKALKELSPPRGDFLDIGTGPATQAKALQQMGHKVTGIDISEKAIEKARVLVPEAIFVHADILSVSFNKKFDYAFDRGCFHIIDPPYRDIYISQLSSFLKTGGYFFLKTFSILGGANQRGPFQFSPLEIRDLFAGEFSILSCHETIYQGQLDTPPNALFSVLKKISS